MKEKIIETKVAVYRFDELSDEYRQLINEAKEQVSKAYAPYSEFHVGAAVLLENGETVTGSNQENSAYPSGLCAERVTMFYATAKYPDVPAKAIAIVAYTNGKFTEEPITPCGSCRQALLETEVRFGKDITVLLYGNNNVFVVENIKQMLPLCFEKSSLDVN